MRHRRYCMAPLLALVLLPSDANGCCGLESEFVAVVRVTGCVTAADALRDAQTFSALVEEQSSGGVYLATEVFCEKEVVYSRTSEGVIHRDVRPVTCLQEPRQESFYYVGADAAVRCEEVRIGGAKILQLSKQCCDYVVLDIGTGRRFVESNCIKRDRRAYDFEKEWDDLWDDQGNLRPRS